MVQWVTAEIRSVKEKPFYCQLSVGTVPFQGRVFLQLACCKANASLQQLLSHMTMVCLSSKCPRNVLRFLPSSDFARQVEAWNYMTPSALASART